MVDYLRDSSWREFMSKHSRSTANLYAVDKRSRIQNWLLQEGWKIADGQHPKASWIVTASQDKGFTLVVVQPASMRDRIEIQAGVGIDESAQKLLAAMDAVQRRSLFWDLRFDLLRMGVDFSGFDDPPKQLNVTQRMYDDGLTKDRFLQRVTKIKNAQIMIIWTINRAFDQPPEDEILGSGFVQ
jgi:hypothetical protein